MNKYLLLSAAAVLVSTAANAGNLVGSFSFGSSGGVPSCDGGTVYSSGKSVWSVVYTNCSSPDSFGQGLVGKYKAVDGKSAYVSDNTLAQSYGIFSEYMSFSLPAKLKTGLPWELWIGLNGTTSFVASSGVIIVDKPAKHRAGKNIKSSLKEMLQAHRVRAKSG